MEANTSHSEAIEGMKQAIYEALQHNLGSGLETLNQDDLDAMREGWRKLALSIATGVVSFIPTNLEVYDTTTETPLETQALRWKNDTES